MPAALRSEMKSDQSGGYFSDVTPPASWLEQHTEQTWVPESGSESQGSVCRLRNRLAQPTASFPTGWGRTDHEVPADPDGGGGYTVRPGVPPGDILPLAFRSAGKSQDQPSPVGSSSRQTTRRFPSCPVRCGPARTQ